jgi:hypothetical protein
VEEISDSVIRVQAAASRKDLFSGKIASGVINERHGNVITSVE